MKRKATIFLLLLGIMVGVGVARDLVMVDRAVLFYDRVNDVVRQYPEGVNGQYFTTWFRPYWGPNGDLLADSGYYAFALFALDDGDTIETAQIQAQAWAERVKLTSPTNARLRGTFTFAAALNQHVPIIQPDEVRRLYSLDPFEDYYPHFSTHVLYFQTGEWRQFTLPHYLGYSGVSIYHLTPDTITAIGVNPAKFKYLLVKYVSIMDEGDSVYVDMEFQPDCRKVLWTPEDNQLDPNGIPSYPAIQSVSPPDWENPNVFVINTEDLIVPDGNYIVTVLPPLSSSQLAPRLLYENYSLPASRGLLTIEVTEEERLAGSIVEFRSGTERTGLILNSVFDEPFGQTQGGGAR